MKVFIVTAVGFGILEHCEVYTVRSVAEDAAVELAKKLNVPLEAKIEFFPKMTGWIVGNSIEKFITIVEREIQGLELLSVNSWKKSSCKDCCSEQEHCRFHCISAPDYIKSKAEIYAEQAKLYDKIMDPDVESFEIELDYDELLNSDEELDLSSPGGFSFPDDKPLTLQDIQDGKDYKRIYELSEHQLHALVTARIRRCENYYRCVTGVYINQKEALRELKEKTDFSKEIIQNECETLIKIYSILDV